MDKPPRLLVVGVASPMETFLQRLLLGLLEQGFQVTVASASRPELFWFDNPGFTWLPTPGWKAGTWKRLALFFGKAIWALLFSRNDLRKIISSLPPLRNFSAWFTAFERVLPYLRRRWDVIYFPWNSAAIDHLLLFKLGMPVVVSCRGSQILIAPHNPRRKDYYKGLHDSLTQAVKVHCVSKSIKDEVMQYELDPAKVCIIYPAVDPLLFQSNQNREKDAINGLHFHVISVGSLAWVKGYDYALQAIALLKAKGVNVHYEIIGTGADRSRVLYTIFDLGIEDCVTLSGYLPPATVIQHLQQSDAFLLASLSEGISNAVLEAMACGLPIVTTECGGMREAVTDGIEGFVTPLRDPTAMAMALTRLNQDPGLRFVLGQAGRLKVLKQHNLDAQILAFEELFQEVVHHG